jgi:2-keto-4-pentenoate hydratase/2-oxohepta-3-ene-1,7-dioic acid hydratase in catechol pathway
MKYCRFQFEGQSCYGLVETVAGREVITRLLRRPPEEAGGDLEDLPSKRMEPLPLDEAVLLPPVRPSKIVCVGLNYHDRTATSEAEIPPEPVIFLKPPSALLPTGGSILRPKVASSIVYEAEVGVVMAKHCHQLSPDEDVRPYILGYTCVNDLSAQGVVGKDGQLTRAKGFDTFCPVGPVVNSEGDPWAGIGVEARVNGELRQQGNTRDFVFALDVVIRSISRVMTLAPGDLISTGTPQGAGPVVAGDIVEITVEGVGTLRNPVADEP